MFVSTITFGSFNDYVPPAAPLNVKAGEMYGGVICGAFHATQDAFQGSPDSKPSTGIAYLIAFRDEDNRLVYKGTKVMTLGRWSFGGNASYGKFVRDMLGSVNVDDALLAECRANGVADPAQWVGRPCVVTFTGKASKTSGKTYFALDRVSAPNKYVKGFEEIPADAPVCCLKDAFSNFVHPQPFGFIVMPNVQIADAQNAETQAQPAQSAQPVQQPVQQTQAQPTQPPACAVNMEALADNEVDVHLF